MKMELCEKILEAAKEAEAGVTGKLGFAFYSLKERKGCFLHGDDPFPTASVYKVYILAELYRQAAEGKVDLDAFLSTPKENPAMGSGILSLLSPELSLRVRDYAKLMMMLSDNVATDLLFELVGRDSIRENVLLPLGLSQTKADYNCTDMQNICYRFRPGMSLVEQRNQVRSNSFRNAPEYTCQMELDNCTSPKDMVTMLRALYEGEWVNQSVCEEMLRIMRPQPTFNRISKYLPKSVIAARKTGSLDRLVNDAGIVYAPEGAYVLVMFYNGNVADEDEYLREDRWDLGSELLAQLSRRVYDIVREESKL